jgi:hypothetical protein
MTDTLSELWDEEYTRKPLQQTLRREEQEQVNKTVQGFQKKTTGFLRNPRATKRDGDPLGKTAAATQGATATARGATGGRGSTMRESIRSNQPLDPDGEHATP